MPRHVQPPRLKRLALTAGVFLLCAGEVFAQTGAPQGASGGGAAPPAQAPATPTGAASGGGGFSGGGGASTGGGGGGSPETMYGLIEVDNRKVISLDDALSRAVQNNFDLRIANEKVVQQEAAVRRAWSSLLPQVSIGGSYTYNYPEQKVAFGSVEQNQQQALLYNNIANLVEQSSVLQGDPQQQRESQEQAAALRAVATQFENSRPVDIVVQPAHLLNANVAFSMPLFNGRALPLLQNAYEAVDLVELTVKQAKQSLLHGVARAYYAAVTTQDIARMAQKQLDNARQHRVAVKDRVDLGVATPLTLSRADLDVARAEQQVRTAENAYLSATGALGYLIGEENAFDVQKPASLAAVELEAKETQLIARAMSSRLDLRVQKAALSMADRNRTDAWMMFLPSVGLAAQGRYTSNTSGFTSQPLTGLVSINAQVPIYDGGARYAALKDTASRIREELLKVKQAETKIERQVRGNIADIHIKRQAIEAAKRSLELAKTAQANAEAMYEAGVATDLDVTDSRLAVFMSEIDVVRQELDLEMARLGLLYILGELPTVSDAEPLPITDGETDSARLLMERLSDD